MTFKFKVKYNGVGKNVVFSIKNSLYLGNGE